MVCGNFIVNGIAFMLYFFFVNNKNAGCGSSIPGLFHPNIYYRTQKGKKKEGKSLFF